MKKTFGKCLAVLLAVVLIAGTMAASLTAFADSQTSQSSSSDQSSITAETKLNSDGSITISGTAKLWGWIQRVAVYKGNQMSDPAATYAAGGYIASESTSGNMNLTYSIDLKGKKVTTEGYTIIAADAEQKAWAAAYVPSPAGTVEGVGGDEEEGGSSDVIGDGKVDVKAVKNADGSVTFSGTVSAPLALQYVCYKMGNHLDKAELVYSGGTKMASYAPNDVAQGADQISGSSYTFNKTFTGRYVSEVGYTMVFQDLWGTNFTAAFIPTQGGTGIDLVKYYGPGVDDVDLKRWATIYKNNKQQQVFAVNEVKQMIANIGTPARTKNADKDELIAWYTEVKPVQEYQYDELYLNDYYVQGVWDTMPAAYGWMQDQYTEPGKWVSQKYGLGQLAYGIAAGGQNPWVLMDYIERNIGVKGANTDGWAFGYDEVAEAPYLWHAETGTLLTYENSRSLQAKIDYINREDLGGVIIWEMSGDNTDTYPMTTQIYNGLKEGKKIVGYFTNWAVYNEFHQKQDPLDLPFDIMTHINYSFMQIENNKIESMDPWADTTGALDYGAPQMFYKVGQMKELYPDTKVLLSVGGWTRGDTFYQMVSNPANRATFVASCVQYLKDYPMFDGIDFDWEYPGLTSRAADHDDPNDRGCPAGKDTDYQNFSALIYEMRQALDADSELVARGSNVLSACLPAAPAKQDAQPCVTVAEYCDFVNVMTYDFHGAFDPVGPVYDKNGNETGKYWSIGYNSPLNAHAETPDEWCTVNAVENLLAKGISREKINIGTPYYSRGWAGIPVDENGVPRGLVDPTPLDSLNGGDEVVLAESVTVTPATAEVEVGKTVNLSATVKPTNAYNKSVTWKSSDATIASVDKNGVVTAVAEGKATITASTSNGKQGTAVITVKAGGGTEVTEADIFVFKLDDKNAYYYNQDMKLPIDGPATYVNGKTYVPFRAVAAAAGITDVKFSNGIITFTGAEGINVKMAIDSTTCVLTLGNQNMNMTIAAPTYVGGVAMLPVRDTASLTGASIVFDNSGYVVVSPEAIDNSKVSAYINAFNK